LNTLAALVRQCDCYRLTFGSLDAACDEIMRAVDHLEARV